MLQLDIVFLIISVVPFIPIITYLLSLIIGNLFISIKNWKNRKHRNINLDISDSLLSPLTIIIPTYNEEKVIKAKLNSIFKINYPSKIVVIVVDDSSDSTPYIIKKFQESNEHIKLIHSEKRMGYNDALILGIENAQTELVILTDSHSFLNESSIISAVRILNEDRKVGSVSGSCRLLNPEKRSSKIERIYQGLFNIFRKAETNISSTFMVKGEFIVARKDLISDLNKINGCFDNESSLWILKKGFKVFYSDKIYYYEYYPSQVKERLDQKKIRAINLLRSIQRFKSIFFNTNNIFIGFFLYPFYYYFSFIFPILVPLSFASFSAFLIILLIRVNYLSLYVIIPSIIVIILVVPYTRRALYSFIQIEFSLLYANYQIFCKSKTEITEIPLIESTRISYSEK